MTGTSIQKRGSRVAAAVAALGLLTGSLALATDAAAQTQLGGTAFGSLVNATGIVTQSPIATLPATGGMNEGAAQSFGVPNTLSSSWLTAVTTGAVDDQKSSAQSTSEVEDVNLLGGLITAANVTAIASSYVSGTTRGSDAEGSGFVNLVVASVPITTDQAPNTRMGLPGVGYVILNEQIRSGDGVTSSGITVNMIHVVLQSALGVRTGEIIVGSAASSVK